MFLRQQHHYFRRFTNHGVQNKYTVHIGAANKATANLIKILTVVPFFSLRLHHTIGATNTVPPIQWCCYADSTNSIGATDFADFLLVSTAAPIDWCNLVCNTIVLVAYKEKSRVSDPDPYPDRHGSALI
jgi:hypothetical protein